MSSVRSSRAKRAGRCSAWRLTTPPIRAAARSRRPRPASRRRSGARASRDPRAARARRRAGSGRRARRAAGAAASVRPATASRKSRTRRRRSPSERRPVHAEVEQADAAVLEHEDVGRVRVAVEVPVLEDHLQPDRHDALGRDAALRERHASPHVAQLRPLDQVEREHAAGRVRPVHAGDHDVLVLAKAPREDGGAARLAAVVELGAQAAPELVDDGHGVHEVEPPAPARGQPREL